MIFKRIVSQFCPRTMDPEAYFDVDSEGNHWEYDTKKWTEDDILCSDKAEEAVAAAEFFLERGKIHAEALDAFANKFDPEIIRRAPAAFGFGPGEVEHYRLTRELVDQDGNPAGVDFILTHPFINANGLPLSWEYASASQGVFSAHKPATISIMVLEGGVVTVKGSSEEEELRKAERLFKEKK